MSSGSPGTSASLLARLRDSGDTQAWQKMVLLYTPLIAAWLRPAGLQASDVEDLTQSVLVVVVRKLPQFQPNGKIGAFRAWLRAITVNRLREFRRAHEPAEQNAEAAAVLEQLEDPASDLSRWWDEEHNHYILNGLLRLIERDFTPNTWRAFRRVVLDEFPAAKVAAELGMSVNAVLIAKSRVLSRLRQEASGIVD